LTAERFASRFGWPEGLTYPLAIGHRGASAHSKENTLEAFALASDLGAQMWELDVQMTSDGVPVVSHDDHLQRVFGLDVRISAVTAAELAQLAAEVPLFSDVAALARERGTGLYIELKAVDSGIPVWKQLQAAEQPFAAIGSFNTGFVRELRDAGCRYPLSVLVPLNVDPHQAADSCRADIVHLCWERGGERPQDLVTDALLARAESDGRAVVLWHEERTDIIADLVRMPVLGICSDAPELLRRAISEPV
jgi:glycerophosphoryl diester phosphodiesterase